MVGRGGAQPGPDIDRTELMNATGRAGRTGLNWVAASVVLVAAAQLLLKSGVSLLAERGVSFFLRSAIRTWNTADIHGSGIYALPIVAAGICCYLVSVICWLRALERLPLSTTYPLLSLSYPLVYLGAIYLPFLQEPASAPRIAGIALVMLGILLLAPAKTEAENRL
jgi:undecaprenyl phosphate-alpha-L-ara4N flippase subunit ArnF